MPENLIVFWIALALMLLGFSGIFFPVIPNIPLIWFAILLYAVVTDFVEITPGMVIFISLLAVLTIVLDYITARWGARRFRVTPFAMIAAVIGGVIGSLFGQLWAVFMGPLLGAVIALLVTGHDAIWAVRRGRVRIIGFMGGSVIKVVIGLMLIGFFIWSTLT